ncbi:Rpn family recombination-promoting nuclease/putative transposase [Leptolyngbya sp. DQ-M1]|uniref:Rpn family recombination-promoting nuclease/putative transposase n=1 Tax=Leptolyngbya sp. DQ-M1 TaxID=2933920 RepID=UPI003299D428
MYDNICKFLAETFSSDFASWLLGEAIELTELSSSELSLEPIRADSLILLQSEATVLHLEFQTEPSATIPFRMLDYRVRLYRRFPSKTVRQFVIYLQPTTSELVQQSSFVLEETRHNFGVIRLWEQPTDLFLQSPGLLPFATLSQTSDRTQALQQVAQVIERIPNKETQQNVAASAFILAGLLLDKSIVQRLLRQDIMKESVTYQALMEEGREEGREQGREQAQREVAIAMLQEGMAIEVIARITKLSIEQIQAIQSADSSQA